MHVNSFGWALKLHKEEALICTVVTALSFRVTMPSDAPVGGGRRKKEWLISFHGLFYAFEYLNQVPSNFSSVGFLLSLNMLYVTWIKYKLQHNLGAYSFFLQKKKKPISQSSPSFLLAFLLCLFSATIPMIVFTGMNVEAKAEEYSQKANRNLLA